MDDDTNTSGGIRLEEDRRELVRSFRFRLKPSSSQHGALRIALERSRQIYNAALEERIDCYRKTGKSLSYYDQSAALGILRKEERRFAWAMEAAPLKALDLAFKAFFARGGFPRFKGRDWFKSIAWAKAEGWKFREGKFLAKGLGAIRVHQHRDLPGPPKTARIKREGRHWYLYLACAIEAPGPSRNPDMVGIDFGISIFAALSDGTLIANPRAGRKAASELRRRQRALARCKRGSKRRAKARERVAKTHGKIRKVRQTHHFQLAADLVGRFGFIAVEDLNIKGLSRSRLARDVNDAAWGQFISILESKAESAGSAVIKVDPRHTSQTCPECGIVEPKLLSQRLHRCVCGYEADRDVAAARVILNRAMHGPARLNVAGNSERAPRKAAA